MNDQARQLIDALRLEPLPHEGGFFRVLWRSDRGSAIYYLMTPEGISALHRLDRDEVWNHHGGDPIEHWQIDPATGRATTARLGPDRLGADRPQVHVPAGCWQGARMIAGEAAHGWSLLVCTVWPAWDERGFELGARDPLLAQFPAHAAEIRALTR